MNHSIRFVSLLFTLVFCSGCVIQQSANPGDPNYAPVMVPTPVVGESQNGSLYSDSSSIDLFGDQRARRVGDILTVMLEETTRSSKSSSLDISKDSGITVPEAPGGAGTLLGRGGLGIGTDLSSEREFKGGSDAAQSNNLSGSVTVSVVDIWPNGTLVIRGEKWLTLNRGNEFIRVSGLVRPSDVTQNNTVVSTKIANARITYSGTGETADSQNMGWINRFFNSPYWPL